MRNKFYPRELAGKDAAHPARGKNAPPRVKPTSQEKQKMKPSDINEELWEIRDILHRAMQMHIADNTENAKAATKEAYQRLSTLLGETQSNLKPPGTKPFEVS